VATGRSNRGGPAVVGLLAMAAAVALRRRRRREAVPPELLAIGNDQLKTELEFTEKFNGRASALVGFAGVVLGLTVTAGVETFPRLTQAPGKPRALTLGHVGEPLFIVCFAAAVLLLLVCTVVATRSILPIAGKRLKIESLREFGEKRTPLPEVRSRAYTVIVNLLDAQRKANTAKAKPVKRAGGLFVAALLLVAIDACTLAISQLHP
jgi:hypothetical protein